MRRRRLVIVLVTLLVPLIAVGYSLSQQRLYEAKSQVLVQRQSIANQLNNSPSQSLSAQDFARILATQASIARSRDVAARVLNAEHVAISVDEFLARSSATAEIDTDLIDFTVTDPNGQRAIKLANAYATTYTVYKRELDTRSLVRARAELRARVARLAQSTGENGSRLLDTLRAKDEQLATLEALQTSNAAVVKRAEDTTLVQPRTIRNLVLALLIGLGLGVACAFVADTLDSRVRNSEEIGAYLQAPLLGRIPWQRSINGRMLFALADPIGIEAEAFRLLRTNIAFASMNSDLRSVVVTSALESEGKSVTASNLAITWARSGKSVILVDLDLRKPAIATNFELEEHLGLTHVLLGHASIDEILADVPLDVADEPTDGRPSPVEGIGRLRVITSGPVPPNPGEIAGSDRLDKLLTSLSDRADIVIIDTPPYLYFGDASALGARSDGVLVVTRLGSLRRPALREMRRALDSAPLTVLGYVVTNADGSNMSEVGYGYGYGNKYYGTSPSNRVQEVGPVVTPPTKT